MRFFTRDELKRLLLAITDERWRLMVLVQFSHGFRVSEVITLTGAEVRDGFISKQRLKGSNRTVHPFIPSDDPVFDEATLLTRYLAETKIGPKEKLFPITRFGALKVVQRAGKKAGIPAHKLTTHALKHSICRETIRKAGIENLQKFVGHRSMNSTAQYLKVSDEQASVAMIAALSGK